MSKVPAAGLFDRPTSAILCGTDRPLLNWVAYALSSAPGVESIWTDVRLDDELLDPSDLLHRDLIPKERFLTVSPDKLARDDFAGNLALGGLVRSDEPEQTVRRFADFLRLPAHTQALIARIPRDDRPVVLVLSNAHRLAALYRSHDVAPTLRAIVESGVSLLMTWADALSGGRLAFDRILHVRGTMASGWRRAVLSVERGPPVGVLRPGAEVALEDYPPVATVLGGLLEGAVRSGP
ncbi:MAG TPA: hypothetical protein VEE86_01300 [Thermoplasmata archaeon]|nr:hypothetical protein [Thermoplasmata archaeon]